MDKKNHYVDLDSFQTDFGFTFSDDEEIVTPVRERLSDSYEEEIQDLRNRLRAVQTIFLPLLEQLVKEPDKPYIKWPNRKDVVQRHMDKLKSLTTV